MNRGSWVALLAIFCSGTFGCGISSESAPVVPEATCTHLGEVDLGEMFLQNNMWGMEGATDFEQCVERSGDPYPLTFRWDWPAGDVDQVRGYPFIGFGQDPWRPSSTLPELPTTVANIGTMSIAHEVHTEADGKYNLAFDIWITKGPGVTSPPEDNITRELMIWLDTTENPLPPEWLVEEVEIDGTVYDFYKGANEPTGSYVRDYLAFVAQTPKPTGTTNIDAFVRYLADNGHLAADEYVRNVFLGNEVWNGTGTTTIDAFVVTFG